MIIIEEKKLRLVNYLLLSMIRLIYIYF